MTQRRDADVIRKTVTVTSETWNKIMNFRFEKRIDSASEAVEQLLVHALEQISQQQC